MEEPQLSTIASETGNEMQNEISLVNSAFSVPFSETNFLIRYIVGFTTVLAARNKLSYANLSKFKYWVNRALLMLHLSSHGSSLRTVKN